MYSNDEIFDGRTEAKKIYNAARNVVCLLESFNQLPFTVFIVNTFTPSCVARVIYLTLIKISSIIFHLF